ncbi:DUF72 domain-containing protein [Macrococcus carouselicus]|uniref:DUF72 domain-containing protein n=1 Tax=Macrococcus carouselicus TaxID=69969 RepID=A0A9Q8CKP1_9STAP|nr:DUF72 domain-containing protein [Macrococcus carouselicus]TDM04709.1 DUF72 domain-containing protein [Macrococcus carouselicus]
MINIGLTAWSDHDTLYPELANKKDKLLAYGSHFPTVELDASYYAIQPERNIRKWINETPSRFKFVVKIHQALTGHADVDQYADTRLQLIEQFNLMVGPLIEEDRLAMVLVQFPPWFDCTTQNINYILYLKQHLRKMPVAIEFRHDSWFTPAMTENTLTFLHDNELIHSVCDEPQSGHGSIPMVNRVTNPISLVRLHGRNVAGWTKKDMSDQEWRDVRYLYEYSEQELQALAVKFRILDQKAKEVFVIFNNNSGGHAAGNALRMKEILGIEYDNLNAKQLTLF